MPVRIIVGGLYLLALAVGCGRVSFDTRIDAGASSGTDADGGGSGLDAVPAQTCGAWQPTERLATLSSGFSEFGAALSDDGLKLYMHADITGIFEIYTATRPTLADPFGAPTRITELVAGATDGNASTTADDLELVFESDRGGGNKCLFIFTRATTTDAWANPVRQDALCVANGAAGGELSRDGLTLYYTALAGTDTWGTLMVTTRASRSVPFPVGVPVAGIDTTASKVGYPALSLDHLTIYFETETPLQLWVATRPSLTAPFEAAQPLSVNLLDGTEADVDISRDGQELYFSSDRTGGDGGFDIYRATRTCTPVL